MLMGKIQKISKGGQLSVPAPIRKRWGARSVLVEDHGDAVVVRPAPDDPVEAAYGAFASLGKPTTSELRCAEREAEAEAEERKLGT
jgi:bifunctional DNA-binding transcriptional regulator/antitoxin component of YhaV-PrlF toxin-antitoxin module